MVVCHITTVHPAQDARIYYRMCRPLALAKIQVSLIAPENFPEEPFLRPSPWNLELGMASRVQRIWMALKAALAEKADVYHFHDPELIPMACALKLVNPRKVIVYDVHEDYPSMMRDKYWLPKPLRPFASFGARLANVFAGKLLDGIVGADPSVERDFRRVAGRRTLVYYNFPILSLFATPESARHAEPKTDLVYVGGMSERSGIFVLLDALGILAEQGVRPTLRLAGYTDGEAAIVSLREAIQRRGLAQQVSLHGRIPHAQVPDWIRAGSIGLVMLQAVPKFMKNIPSKMFEYWACGLPVIASDLPPIRQFLTSGLNGRLFSPGAPRQLAEQIHYLLEHPAEGKSIGRIGRRMVEEYWNNESQVARLIQFYERLCDRPVRTVQPDSAQQETARDLERVTAIPADSLGPRGR